MAMETEAILAGGDTPQNSIEAKSVVVERGGRAVLKGFSCSVPAGSVTGLLGPSGSGKTTLMRCIVGVQRIRAGQVNVLGQPAGSPALRHRVGYMTQAPSVYADLTVRENTRYFASLYGLSSTEADQAAADVGLRGLLDQLVQSLSGGERARASLACVLVGRPDVLILDEPTVGQDPVLREELWRRFHDLARAGTTLLVSSHVMDEAKRCDSLLLIREGQLIATGSPGEVLVESGAEDLDEAFLRLVRARTPAADT